MPIEIQPSLFPCLIGRIGVLFCCPPSYAIFRFPCLIGRIGVLSQASVVKSVGSFHASQVGSEQAIFFSGSPALIGFHASQVGSEWAQRLMLCILYYCFHASQVGSEFDVFQIFRGIDNLWKFPCLIGRIGVRFLYLHSQFCLGLVSMPHRQDRSFIPYS